MQASFWIPLMTPARAQNSGVGGGSPLQSRRAAKQALTRFPAQTHQCDVTSQRQSGPVDVYVTSLVSASQSLSMWARLAPTCSLFLLCSFRWDSSFCNIPFPLPAVYRISSTTLFYSGARSFSFFNLSACFRFSIYKVSNSLKNLELLFREHMEK